MEQAEIDDPSFERLWSVQEVAHYLRVSVPTVYRMSSADKIPVAMVNGSLRFNPRTIRQWVENLQDR